MEEIAIAAEVPGHACEGREIEVTRSKPEGLQPETEERTALTATEVRGNMQGERPQADREALWAGREQT